MFIVCWRLSDSLIFGSLMRFCLIAIARPLVSCLTCRQIIRKLEKTRYTAAAQIQI